jgi:predicted small secreted protein
VTHLPAPWTAPFTTLYPTPVRLGWILGHLERTMRRIPLAILLALVLWLLAGCNTASGIVTGLQRDLSSMTQAAAEWQASD